MNITTFSKKRYMTDEFYFNHPMQMVELKMNMIIDNIPYLRNTL